METSTPNAARTKKNKISMAMSPIVQSAAKGDSEDRKVYSKRTRKPRKMYEFEDSSLTEKDVENEQLENSADQKQHSYAGSETKTKSLSNVLEEKRKRNKKTKLSTALESSKSGDTDLDNTLPDDNFVSEKHHSEKTIESVDTCEETNAINSDKKSEKTVEAEQTEARGVITTDSAIEPEKQIVKRKGRPPKSKTIISNKQSDTPSFSEADNGSSKNSAKKRGRPKGKKIKEDNTCAVMDSSVGNDSVGDMFSNSMDVSIETPRRGRKRKVLDYAAINSGSQEDNDDEHVEKVTRDTPASSRKKKNEKKVDSKGIEEEDAPKTTTPSGQKKSSKMKEELKCPKCEELFKNISGLQKHAALEHQIWWTPENPEGDGTERSSIQQIYKFKKYLNCTKCDKRINHVHYYHHHIEWCGREDERYTCEDCGHRNLKAMWRQHHRLNCQGMIRLDFDPKSDSDKEKEEDVTDSSLPRKRKAAKKALSMVHNISKDDLNHEDKDDDPDVKIDNDDDDDDDDDDMEEIDEDELDSNGEGKEPSDDDDDDKSTSRNSRAIFVKRGGAPSSRGTYNKYLDTYPLMLKYAEKKKSEEFFQDLLPAVKQWTQIKGGENSKYLPVRKDSVQFKMSKGKELISLQFSDSVSLNGLPVMFTGLFVWKLAWCPMPFRCKDDQYLAVVGKLNKSTIFSPVKQGGPGVIQIWNCGPLSIKGEVKKLPSLWYCVAHEFGLATEIKWCPSGCYNTNSEQDDNYPRLGLLAASFTDGTVRIFSLPLLQEPQDTDVRIYKGVPVVTLYIHHHIDSINVSCMCMDWLEVESNRKIMAGYSDGKVCLFDLESKSPPLLMKSDSEDGKCILPYKTFQAHGKLVRTVRWLSGLKDLIVTGCENFETYIWNLSNTNFPIFQDNGMFMVTCSTSSLWHPGILLGSDDNYAIASNKSRYLEAGSFAYSVLSQNRRDEACAFFFTSQPACVWDVSFSNWLSFVVACDNRGCLEGMPMHDPLLYTADTKVYRYRQILFCTEEKPIKKETKANENIDNCDGNSKEIDEIQTNQSNTSLQKSDQSENVIDTSNDTTISSKSIQSNNKNQQSSKISDGNKTDSEGPVSEDLDNKFLNFTEYFKNPKSWMNESETDKYVHETQKSLKTVQINPNHLQCTWMAFGGDSGLVRLANIVNSIPIIGRSHLPT